MMYESDHTRFMRELLTKNPQWRQSQQEGRARWWDQVQSLERQQQFTDATVPLPAYVYQTKV